ncbi:unnamed protein product, partial [Aphanomyces euteiches]
AYGDMRGLGEIEYGQEDPNEVGNDENSDKRKAVDELQAQRQQRGKPKYDVGAGLVALGDSLAKGMTDAAALRAVPDPSHSLMIELLAETKSLLTATNLAQEKTAKALEVGNQ